MQKKWVYHLSDWDAYHSQCTICITEEKLCTLFSQTQRSYIKKLLMLFSPNNLVVS